MENVLAEATLQETNTSSDPTLEKSSNLKNILEKAGLEPDKWSKLFNDVLDIKNNYQLLHLQENDFFKMCKHAKHEWEKIALRSLLQNETDKVEKLKQVMAEATENYKKLTPDREEAIKCISKIGSMLRIPEIKWESEIKKQDLLQIVQTLECQSSKLDAVIHRQCLTDTDVIRKASGGLALMGVYDTGNLRDICVHRKTVIELTKALYLTPPLNKNEDETVDFSSQEMYNNFHQAMNVIGVNLSGFVREAGCQLGSMFKRNKSSENISNSQVKRTFLSSIKYSSVPVKSCELSLDSIRFVPEASRDLLRIDNLISFCCRKQFIVFECQKFYEIFGSHINLGSLTFGGTYKWVATYNSESEKDIKTTKEMVETCLNAYIAVHLPVRNIGSEISAKAFKESGKLSNLYSETDLTCTKLKILKRGGPPELDDYYIWKYTLPSCNDTWALIDRGKFVPIWEIVQKLDSNITNGNKLSKYMKDALGCERITNDFALDKMLEENMMKLFDNLQNWVSHPTEQDCVPLLQSIIQIKQLKVNIDGDTSLWKDLVLLDDRHSQFLNSTMEQENLFQQDKQTFIKYLIREIFYPHLKSSILRSHSLDAVAKWVLPNTSDDSLSSHENEKIQSVNDLINSIKEDLCKTTSPFPLIANNSSMKQEMLTCKLAKLTRQCLNCFDSTGESYSIVFLKSLLKGLKYDDNHHCFPVYLSIQQVNDFLLETEHNLKEYEGHKQSIIRLQAYLICLILNKTKNTSFQRERIFNELLNPMDRILEDEISTLLNEYTHSVPYDWLGLEEGMLKLKSGNKIAVDSFTFPGIDKVKSINTLADPLNQPSNATCNQTNFTRCLDHLGLTEYYPEKIRMTDISTKKIEEKNPKVEDIPWLYLKHILMCNSNYCSVLKDHFDVLNPIDSFSDDESDSDMEDETANIKNPLDITFAVFKCSSPVLKQRIAVNLFLCKLAVPLIFPDESHCDALTISCWPIRGIIIDRKSGNSSEKSPALNCPCRIVSFMRYGELGNSISKSTIINHMLFGEQKQYHDTFVNSESILGREQREISSGFVEAAWFIPSKKYEDVSLFLNLRGDAKDHSSRQDFLQNISSVLVVVLKKESVNEFVEKNLSNLQKIPKVVLAVKTEKSGKSCQTSTKSCPTIHVIKLYRKGQRKSYIEIAEKLWNLISSIKVNATNSLLNLLRDNQSLDINIDESSYMYSSAKLKSKTLIGETEKKNKSEILPLQHDPWHKLTRVEKQLYKSSEYCSYAEKGLLQQKMTKYRLVQLQKLQNVSRFMQTFVNYIIKSIYSEQDSTIFYTDLKLCLNEKTEKEQFKVESEYFSALSSLKSEKKRNSSKDIHILQAKVKQYGENLSHEVFGIEHLFREMAQIYEAMTYSLLETKIDDEGKALALQLPQIFARLVRFGVPLEIMDGDTANVPRSWVKAVLSELENQLGEKKMFTLSVLGIQSSGKSTLLNTMFGIEFPVGAGRCTRGIFMQLIPLAEDSEYDYMLIMDTEGLRAPELYHDKFDSDNKLATFVLGLGDITIINIKGESSHEMKDVLQIAVEAFLRLKLAQKSVHLRQSCIFAHQNISTGERNNSRLPQQLLNQLNEITRDAAQNENIYDIHSFDDIIEFELEKDIWIFSDVWVGSPPMAPRNPDYSKTALKLKESVIQKAVQLNYTSSFSGIASKIDDLWKAILTDDFVFRFRNSLELKAYTLLQKKVGDLNFEVKTFASKFVNSDAKSQFANCKNKQTLDITLTSVICKFDTKLKQMVGDLQEKLRKFVKNHLLKDKMSQYEQSKINTINLQSEETKLITRNKILHLKEEKRIEISYNYDKDRLEADINQLASDVSLKFKGQSPDRIVVKEEFNNMWTKLMTSFASEYQEESQISITDEISPLVYKRFPEIASYLEQQHPLCKDYVSMEKLVGSIEFSDLQEGYVTFKHDTEQTRKDSVNLEYEWKNNAISFTDKLLCQIDDELKDMQIGDVENSITKADTVFHIMAKAFDNESDFRKKLTFQPQFKSVLIAHVLKYIITLFENRYSVYMANHTPQAKMKIHKKTAFIYFECRVHAKSKNVTVAKTFQETLKNTMIGHISEDMPMALCSKIKEHFPNRKSSLIIKILSDLAKMQSFVKFFQYINSPKVFVKKWLSDHIRLTMFKNREGEYFKVAKVRTEEILTNISDLVAKTKAEGSVTQWIQTFRKDVNDSCLLPMSGDCFGEVSNGKSTDVQHFKNIVIDQLDDLKLSVLEHFESESDLRDDLRDITIDILMETLWGCDATCPFCNEPCKHEHKLHFENDKIPHECLQHRIPAVAGHYEVPRWYNLFTSNSLILEMCNDLVNQKRTFYINKEYIPWKKYTEYFPQWDLEQSSGSNKYWQWFVYTYKDNIEKDYNIKLPKLPEEWGIISRRDAINSLNA